MVSQGGLYIREGVVKLPVTSLTNTITDVQLIQWWKHNKLMQMEWSTGKHMSLLVGVLSPFPLFFQLSNRLTKQNQSKDGSPPDRKLPKKVIFNATDSRFSKAGSAQKRIVHEPSLSILILVLHCLVSLKFLKMPFCVSWLLPSRDGCW